MGHTDPLGATRADSHLWGHFITCPFCQSFWIALVLLLAFARADAVAMLFSAVMYAYLASRLDQLAATTIDKIPGGSATRPGQCSGCK